jgi:hypothetical protein
VAGRTDASVQQMGNQVGVMPVALPTRGRPEERLRRIAAITAAHKSETRGASALIVVPAFRLLSTLGILEPLVERQHLVNTFVTNLRGPDNPMSFMGMIISEVVPMTITAGNVDVAFAVLSYAGVLGVTVIADATTQPHASEIAEKLEGQLHSLVEVPSV